MTTTAAVQLRRCRRTPAHSIFTRSVLKHLPTLSCTHHLSKRPCSDHRASHKVARHRPSGYGSGYTVPYRTYQNQKHRISARCSKPWTRQPRSGPHVAGGTLAGSVLGGQTTAGLRALHGRVGSEVEGPCSFLCFFICSFRYRTGRRYFVCCCLDGRVRVLLLLDMIGGALCRWAGGCTRACTVHYPNGDCNTDDG